MLRFRSSALAALALVLVAGCSPKGGGGANTAAGSPGAPAAPASGPDTVITEADLPHLKAGVWEITTSGAGEPTETRRRCETGESIKPQQVGKGCSKFELKRTFLGGFVIDAVCASGGVASTMHITASGDFNSSYSSDNDGTMTVTGQAPVVIKTHTEGRYIGPCPAGAADGDG